MRIPAQSSSPLSWSIFVLLGSRTRGDTAAKPFKVGVSEIRHG